MTIKAASPQEIDLFVKTAVDRLVSKGLTEEAAAQKVMDTLAQHAEEAGLLGKTAEAGNSPAPAGEQLSAEEVVIGLAHQKLVQSGLSEKQASEKLITFLDTE